MKPVPTETGIVWSDITPSWRAYGEDPMEALLNIIDESLSKMTPAKREAAIRKVERMAAKRRKRKAK